MNWAESPDKPNWIFKVCPPQLRIPINTFLIFHAYYEYLVMFYTVDIYVLS